METKFKQEILAFFDATEAVETEVVQNLWSGYGKIVRVKLTDSRVESIIVKQVVPPVVSNHPRGWNSDASHQRKLKSYQVEMEFYKKYSSRCAALSRVPRYYFSNSNEGVNIAMEDLDAAGYSKRKSSVNLKELKLCLSWLANFHATFMHVEPNGLWPVGTYWHLGTRQDEFKSMADGKLKEHAAAIDQHLTSCTFQTLVHGDAKLANFCFSGDGERVAAVDFQYVGGGCGMKDVAYFLGSCLDENECKDLETELLEYYFLTLKNALKEQEIDFDTLEQEWRAMYPYAWSDFTRFLLGWSPGHQKLHAYSKAMVDRVLF